MTRQGRHIERTAAADAATKAELMRSALSGALTRWELIRRDRGAGLGLAAVAALVLARRDAGARGSSIPPNCIRVCCDGTRDSWKTCWRCVKWPRTTTTATLVETP